MRDIWMLKKSVKFNRLLYMTSVLPRESKVSEKKAQLKE